MKFISHFAHVHPYAYLTLVVILTAAILASLIVLRRRNRKKVAALLDLFDPGTAEFQENAAEYIVQGRFHGRPASVSATRRFLSKVELSVAGRFYLPFEAQTSRWRWLSRIQTMTNWQSIWLFSLSFQAVFDRSFFAKFMLVLFALIVVATVTLNLVGKLSGYFEETPPSVFEIDLNGLGVRSFATYQPARFRASIEHSEIRESFAHLLGSCSADILKVPGRVRGDTKKEEKWTFAVEVTWLSRDRFLNRETVNKTLTELATLCTDFDQVAPDPWLS